MALALGTAAIYTYARSRSESRSRNDDAQEIPPPPGHFKGVVRQASARLTGPLRHHQLKSHEGSLLGPTRSSSSQTSHKSAKSSAASSRTDLHFDERRASSLPGNFPELIAQTSGSRTSIMPTSDSSRRGSPSRPSMTSDPVEDMTEAAIRASSKLQTFFFQTLGQRLVDQADGMRATHTKQDFSKPLSSKDAVRSRLLYVCASMSLAADFQEFQRRQAQKSRQSSSDSSSESPLGVMNGAKEAALKDFVSSQAPIDSKERRQLEAAVLLGTKAQIVNAIGQSLKLGNALGLLCAFEARRLTDLSYQKFPELRALLKNQHTPNAKIRAFSKTVDPWWSKQLEDYHQHYTSIRSSADAKANPVLSSESRSGSAERHARAIRGQQQQQQIEERKQQNRLSSSHSRTGSTGSGSNSSHGLPKKKRQSSGGAALGTMRLVPSSKASRLSRLSWGRLPPELRHPAIEPTSDDEQQRGGPVELPTDLHETISLPSRPRRSMSSRNNVDDDHTSNSSSKRASRTPRNLSLSSASLDRSDLASQHLSSRPNMLRYMPSTIEEASPTQERTPTRTQSESHIVEQLVSPSSQPTSHPRQGSGETAPPPAYTPTDPAAKDDKPKGQPRPSRRRMQTDMSAEAAPSPVDALSVVDDLEDYLQAAHPELFEGAKKPAGGKRVLSREPLSPGVVSAAKG